MPVQPLPGPAEPRRSCAHSRPVLGELSAGEVQSLFDVARMAGNFQDKSFRNLSCVRVGDHIVRLKPVLAFANILTELCPDGDGVEAYWFKVNPAINAIR